MRQCPEESACRKAGVLPGRRRRVIMPLVLFWSVWMATAALAAAMLAQRLIGWTAARGAIDIPNERSCHVRATPRGGGLAIVAVTLAAAALVCVLHPEAARGVLGAILPAAAVAAVSWIDDMHSLSKRLRFAVHVGSAIAATAVLGPVERIDLGGHGGHGGLGTFELGLAAWPLTILWIAGLTNAFNFMDGIDGIAGITAAVAGLVLAAVAAGCRSPAVGGIAAAFAAAAGGFLVWNWQPARIFMGDVGSAFCGFMLATLPLALPRESIPAALPIAIAPLCPFILDTGLTLVRRLVARENIFQAHRSHLYQRLVIAGWSHRAVAALYGLLAVIAGALAILKMPVVE